MQETQGMYKQPQDVIDEDQARSDSDAKLLNKENKLKLTPEKE